MPSDGSSEHLEALILVTGQPATGKTTVARALARDLGWPLVAKDTIKEAAHPVIGAEDVDGSRRLSRLAFEVMLALAPDLGRCILEGNFDAQLVGRRLLALHPAPIEIFCRCDADLAVERYERRERHPVHRDDEMVDELRTRLEHAQQPLDLGGPVLVVDTGGVVDDAAIAAWVRSVLA